ncbi:MAG: GHKL domain-containing protein [Mucilaginibacter polytrichastri]|nr:GHKL domain-containing protein [Mucilaginibacter polytrichastri]
MTFKSSNWSLIWRVLILFVVLCAAAFTLLKERYELFIAAAVMAFFGVMNLIRFQKKTQDELAQFVEAVHYRDFSRYFSLRNAPDDIKSMRKGFNEINTTFRVISREKETQYHYLKMILELVDTGILSFDTNTGEVSWLNESFKKITGIPYLKTIEALEKRDPGLHTAIMNLQNGQQRVVTIQKEQQSTQLLLNSSTLLVDGAPNKLVSIQNVNEALDETESKAWQKLLSVLTHEIMNSIAPISSLADTLKNRLKHAAENDLAQDDIEDLELGMDTIKRRSDGLLKFAETYRSLNKIKNLNVKELFVRDIFERLNLLMLPSLKGKNIELNIVLRDPSIKINADENLVEQVLINLLVNAIEAIKSVSEPTITLSAEFHSNNKTYLHISDNGGGIAPELLDKIFIPFFSTRKTGSGIGLSLCKQIMLLHNGNIQVKSVVDGGTVFSLIFP